MPSVGIFIVTAVLLAGTYTETHFPYNAVDHDDDDDADDAAAVVDSHSHYT